MLSKQHSGKTKRCRWFRCSRIKMPKIRREKPRPSQRLPSGNGIRRNRPTIENRALKSDGSTFDQVKSVRWFPCFEYHLVLFETRWHSRLCQNSDVIHRNSLQERVGQRRAARFFDCPNSSWGFLHGLTQFYPGRLEATHHYLAPPLEQLVAHSGICLATLPESSTGFGERLITSGALLAIFAA